MALKHRILVVDDDPDNRDLIGEVLSGRFGVIQGSDGEEGLRLARSESPDLIILDIALPKLDGFEVCQSLRSLTPTRDIPIIMLTVSADLEDRIMAFQSGADDFIEKPCRPTELLARVQSKIRRVEERQGDCEVLECGNLLIDLKRLEAFLDDRPLGLSLLEFSLLKFLVQNKERVMSRQKILETVWHGLVVSDRTIDTHIVSLRKRLQGFDHAITTFYGAGYAVKKTRA